MNNTRNYKVYIHTISRDLTGYPYDKYYVGITNRKYLNDRFGKNGEGYKNQVFYNAIKKYGWDNIWHEVLFDNLTREEACKLEKEMIKKYDSMLGHHGYNVSEGGESCEFRKGFRPIYCVELKTIYRNSCIAEKYTNEDRTQIYSRCEGYYKCKDKDLFISRCNTLKYNYCFLEDMWTFSKIKISQKSIPSVDIFTGKSYYNYNFANKVEDYIYSKKKVKIENYESYYLKHKDKENKPQVRLMSAKDYLTFFEKTEKNDKL